MFVNFLVYLGQQFELCQNIGAPGHFDLLNVERGYPGI